MNCQEIKDRIFPLKLYKISRFFFFVIAIIQAILLSHYMVKHEDDNYRYYGLAAVVSIPLAFFVVASCYKYGGLEYRLSIVWLLYAVSLVILIGCIFGKIVIKDNELKEMEIAPCFDNATSEFFDSKFLKITLCFTPGEMLLLLTSVTDEAKVLATLYFTVVMDLFDGVEMLEVLHEDVRDKIPEGWKIAVLVAACLFFLLSFLGIHQVKLLENDDAKTKNGTDVNSSAKWKYRKNAVVVNTIFEIFLNLCFLIIRLALWSMYDLGSTIFLAKNVIGLVIVLVPVLEECGVITTKECGAITTEECGASPVETGHTT